ncbi:putative sporulation protein YyaC [Bhargavaea cecembensis DSE10]|uniref:Putative sporulation protein YyaC n=1 Tax=Bhargavaea cecembensis DSE10 TaxID=1235279 RepID=M7NFV5_9BACL|nr:spore protease YyaC [Bhargavaea cecembensis]EMR06127.1 putative sporulation protein YyaC [Bhargavaea cecembensis DSE10]
MFPFIQRRKTIQTAESRFSYRYASRSPETDVLRDMASELVRLQRSHGGDTVFLCIGSDRSTGDSYGPFVGKMLKEQQFPLPVFGTIEEPVHALNLKKVLGEIDGQYTDPLIVSIDACLGDAHQIGSIIFNEGPLIPGYAIQNPLPGVGACHFKAVVNHLDPHFPADSLNNTRLDTVLRLAEITSGIIMDSVRPAILEEA